MGWPDNTPPAACHLKPTRSHVQSVERLVQRCQSTLQVCTQNKIPSAASTRLAVIPVGTGGGIRLASHHATPQDSIEGRGINCVRPLKVEIPCCICPPGRIVKRLYRRSVWHRSLLTFRNEIRMHRYLTQASRQYCGIRGKVRPGCKCVRHRIRIRIVHPQMVQPQQILDRAQDIHRVVEGMNNGISLSVCRYDECRRTMRIYVVWSILRIIFHDENRLSFQYGEMETACTRRPKA